MDEWNTWHCEPILYIKKKVSEANDIVVQSILKKINVNADVNVPRRKYQILQYFMENWSKKKHLKL